jgi:hypothetical protein
MYYAQPVEKHVEPQAQEILLDAGQKRMLSLAGLTPGEVDRPGGTPIYANHPRSRTNANDLSRTYPVNPVSSVSSPNNYCMNEHSTQNRFYFRDKNTTSCLHIEVFLQPQRIWYGGKHCKKVSRPNCTVAIQSN